MKEVQCPHCKEKLWTVEGKIFPTLEDNERCKSLSPIYRLRCTNRIGHDGSHKHYPWEWKDWN